MGEEGTTMGDNWTLDINYLLMFCMCDSNAFWIETTCFCEDQTSKCLKSIFFPFYYPFIKVYHRLTLKYMT